MCTKIPKKPFSMLNVRKMRQNDKDLLKNQPFYSSEIESSKKKNKKISNTKLLYELQLFQKEPKELSNIELSKSYHFHQKQKEDLKD